MEECETHLLTTGRSVCSHTIFIAVEHSDLDLLIELAMRQSLVQDLGSIHVAIVATTYERLSLALMNPQALRSSTIA